MTSKLLFLSLLTLSLLALLFVRHPVDRLKDLVVFTLEEFNLLQHLGGNGPYVPYKGLATPSPLPACTVTQVHLLHRHNERYPTSGAGAKFEATLKKLLSANTTGHLSFLNSYDYFVTDPDAQYGQLTEYGLNGAFKKGEKFRHRYGHLFENFHGVFPIFSASSNRDLVTAQHFMRGLNVDNSKIITVSESHTQGANSLTPDHSCPIYSPGGDKEAQAYLAVFNATLVKLQKLAPNSELSLSDVKNLLEMCAFEITSTGARNFCDVFTEDEHVLNGYGRALRYFFRNGPGHKLSATLGSVYANATLTLLRQESQTLPAYISFTHDTHINFFLSALGIFSTGNLSYESPSLDHPWVQGDLTPMGGEIAIEKLQCEDAAEFVRLLINETPVPFYDCTEGPANSCPLKRFADILGARLLDYPSICLEDSTLPHALTFFWDWS